MLEGLRDTGGLAYQLEAGRLYGQTQGYRRKLEFALGGIEAMHDLAPNSYMALSFGKQSICLAHMLYEFDSHTPMFFLASSESWLMYDFERVIDAFLSRWPVRLTIVQTNRWGLDLEPVIERLAAKQPGIRWVRRGWLETSPVSWKAARDAGDQDLQEMCDRNQWDGWYWGLAKDESYGRWRTLSVRWPGQPHPTIFRYTDGKYRCCPLMNWTTKEIAAYVAEYDLPLLSAYGAGLEARTSARLTKRMANFSGLARLRRDFPQVYLALTRQFPELRSYT